MEKKLFYQYLGSAILTSLSGMLCVQIDGIIVSHLLGAKAFAAIGALMPLVQAMLTLCLLIGVGGALRLAYAIGAKKKLLAHVILHTTQSLLLISSLSFVALVGYSSNVASWFCRSAELLPAATEYARVLLLSAPVYLLLQGSGALARAEGFPKRVLAAVVIANCLNLGLDFLFISGFKLGIAGAGWATTLSNLVAVVIIATRKRQKIEFSVLDEKKMTWQQVIADIFWAGAPIALGSIAMFFRIGYLTANISTWLGAEGMITLSLLMSILLFVNLVVAGTSQALQPLAGRYMGEQNNAALYGTCRRALRFTEISSVALTLLVLVLAGPFAHLYGINEQLQLVIPTLRIFSINFLFFSLVYMIMVIQQVFGNQIRAMIIAIVQPLMLIPILYLIAHWNIKYIWWAFPLTEIINFIFVLILSTNVLRTIYATAKSC